MNQRVKCPVTPGGGTGSRNLKINATEGTVATLKAYGCFWNLCPKGCQPPYVLKPLWTSKSLWLSFSILPKRSLKLELFYSRNYCKIQLRAWLYSRIEVTQLIPKDCSLILIRILLKNLFNVAWMSHISEIRRNLTLSTRKLAYFSVETIP